MRVYLKDFDNNGKEEAIVTHYHGETETVFSSKAELVKQLPHLNKKFLSYRDFANATVIELFGKENLEASDQKQVHVLEHSVFLNDGNNNFTRSELPYEAQLSSVKTLYLHDFNEDGLPDILLAGNDFHINTQLGRLDAGHGEVLMNLGNGSFEKSTKFRPEIKGQARAVSAVKVGNETQFLVTRNNKSPVVLKTIKSNE